MAMNEFLGYDPNEEPGLAPAGTYRMECQDVEFAVSKQNANNRFLKIKIAFAENNYAPITKNFNIHNDNPTAEQIGRREHNQLLAALGIDLATGPSSEADYIGVPFMAEVGREKNKRFGVDENTVSKFERISLKRKSSGDAEGYAKLKKAAGKKPADLDELDDEEPTPRAVKQRSKPVRTPEPEEDNGDFLDDDETEE